MNIIEEYIRCKEDFEYFRDNYIKIQNKGGEKIYLSIPITGRDLYEVKECADNFKSMINKIYQMPVEVITPFDVIPLSEKKPYAQMMGECIAVLLTCDLAYFAPFYEFSKGCMLEMDTCKRYDIPVHHIGEKDKNPFINKNSSEEFDIRFT